jgi:hypothetical protein
MKLYHFTIGENLGGIRKRGLVPAIGKNSHYLMTFGIPVVWLTSKPVPTWMDGVPDADELRLLTVDVKRGKHLHHWRSWLGSHEADGIDECGKSRRFIGKDLLAVIDRDAESGERGPFTTDPRTDTENYFIYTGTIHRKRIITYQRVNYVTEREAAP